MNWILDINAQDEFGFGELPDTTKIDILRPKCERNPAENQLFSSDNFPGNYKKVFHKNTTSQWQIGNMIF